MLVAVQTTLNILLSSMIGGVIFVGVEKSYSFMFLFFGFDKINSLSLSLIKIKSPLIVSQEASECQILFNFTEL